MVLPGPVRVVAHRGGGVWTRPGRRKPGLTPTVDMCNQKAHHDVGGSEQPMLQTHAAAHSERTRLAQRAQSDARSDSICGGLSPAAPAESGTGRAHAALRLTPSLTSAHAQANAQCVLAVLKAEVTSATVTAAGGSFPLRPASVLNADLLHEEPDLPAPFLPPPSSRKGSQAASAKRALRR
ncbi:hypothetical protein CB1_001428011 [Camelus ferus]|nr:hypothetical protein CB1_001428011 [Camelus ferus]